MAMASTATDSLSLGSEWLRLLISRRNKSLIRLWNWRHTEASGGKVFICRCTRDRRIRAPISPTLLVVAPPGGFDPWADLIPAGTWCASPLAVTVRWPDVPEERRSSGGAESYEHAV